MRLESSGRDGTGGLIDSSGRVLTNAISLTRAQSAVFEGRAWTMNTGQILLTSSTESAVAFFKNNNSRTFVIDSLIFNIETPDSGATVSNGSFYLYVVKNPTSISTSTVFDIVQNRNSSYPNTLPNGSEAIKGAEGATLTGGEDWAFFTPKPGDRIPAPLDFDLTNGDSLGITITPRVTGGSLGCYVVIAGHYDGGVTAF